MNFKWIALMCVSLNCFAQSEMLIRDELDEKTNLNIEQLDWLIFQKVNLEDFLSTPELYSIYLNQTQYLNLLSYYQEQGEFLDLLELQNIDGFEYADYLKLSTIIQCDYKIRTKSSRQVQYKRRLKFSESSEKEKLLFNNYEQERIAFQLNNVIKFAWNKERDFKEDKFYHSTFLQYQQKNFEIGLGNYEVFFGQGLLFGQSFLNSSILGFTGITSNTRSFKSVANNNENNSLQGIYASYFRPKTQIHLGYDINKHGIIEYEHRHKKYKYSILLSKQNNKKLASSSYFEKRFRNIVAYAEFAHDIGLAYSIGGILLLNNSQQFTLSKTYFSKTFDSDYSAPTVFGIKNQNESGYRIAYSHAINYVSLLELRCIYRSSDAITKTNEIMAQQMKYDVAVHKNYKTRKYSFQYSYIDQLNHRYRLRVQFIFNENWQTRYQILCANQHNQWSFANSISLQYKYKKWSFSNLFCFGKIKDGVPIYYNEQSAAGRITNNLFDGGRFNDMSISTRLYKYFYLRGNLQHYYKYLEKNLSRRVFIQFEIKC